MLHGMRKLVIAGVLAVASIAAADGKQAERPKTTCKKVDKKMTCTIEAPVTVSAPKPNVMIVPEDGRKTVGRPKSGDRLSGLSHQLR